MRPHIAVTHAARLSAKRRSAASSSFEIESLENRKLFAVTVTEGFPGFFEVVGDDAADNISISVSMHDHTFTLDGTTYADVSYISVQANGGNDVIDVNSVDGRGDIGAGILGGDGMDSISLNFDGAIWGGEGDDFVNLTDSFYGQVLGEGGSDEIYVKGDCVSADIEGGDGNDFIDCSNSALGLAIFGDAGNDTIYGSEFDDQVYGGSGRDIMIGGSGNDDFYSSDGELDSIVGGNGWDILHADSKEGLVIGVEEIVV